MTGYIALLRAVNLMGSTTLPMAELRAIAEAVGFKDARTLIASGNLVFASAQSEDEVKRTLEAALERRAGRPIGVMVRTAAEMADVAAANPFSDRPPNKVLALFLDQAPVAEVVETARHRADEEIALGLREIYIHYPLGQGQSRLALPMAKHGTGRNMNTVAKLAEMAANLDG